MERPSERRAATANSMAIGFCGHRSIRSHRHLLAAGRTLTAVYPRATIAAKALPRRRHA